MLNLFLREKPLVILLLIESYNSLNIKLFKYVDIFTRMMPISLISISLLYRPHKSHKLSWNNPIKVSILNSFILFIFFNIECLKVVPFKFDSIF